MLKMALAVSLALTAGLTAAATTTVNINPDAGGSDPVLNVGSLDWATSSGLATNITSTSPAGTTSIFYAHSFLNAFQDANAVTIGGTGLNSAYEWTYVTGFQEVLTATSTPLNLRFATTGATGTVPNFFEIYFDTSRDANPLAGTGYNDGILVLSGHILAAPNPVLGNSNFSVTGGGAGTPLDNFGTDNYPNIDSVTGTGGGSINIQVDSVNAAFISGILAGDIFQLAFDTQQNLPFQQTNPSGCFWDGSALIPGAGDTGGATNCGANTLGAINGPSGPNTEIQTDSSNAFLIETVPEPGSLLLLGAGLLGLGVASRRRMRLF